MEDEARRVATVMSQVKPMTTRRSLRKKRPSIAAEVFTPSILAGILASLVVAGLMSGAYWLTAGGLVALGVLVQAYVWYLEDTRAPEVTEEAQTPEVVMVQPEEGPRFIPYRGPSGDRAIQLTRRPGVSIRTRDGVAFTLSPRQMDQLVTWARKGQDGGGVRRDSSAVGKGWRDLDPAVTGTEFTLARQALLDEGLVEVSGKTLVWTADSRDWMDDWMNRQKEGE